jgi:beta-xylosidase
MIKKILSGLLILLSQGTFAQAKQAQNPILFADVPDLAIVRVGETYYMSSTTMHMSPGVPIMKSTDLVNWKIVNYAYDTLANMDELNLTNGKSTYGKGSWASSIRYHNGMYYVTSFAQTTGKTYVFSTNDIEKGKWKTVSFTPAYHDHSLFFDDNGKAYLIYGNGKISLVELEPHASRVKPGGINQVLIVQAGKRSVISFGWNIPSHSLWVIVLGCLITPAKKQAGLQILIPFE